MKNLMDESKTLEELKQELAKEELLDKLKKSVEELLPYYFKGLAFIYYVNTNDFGIFVGVIFRWVD